MAKIEVLDELEVTLREGLNIEKITNGPRWIKRGQIVSSAETTGAISVPKGIQGVVYDILDPAKCDRPIRVFWFILGAMVMTDVGFGELDYRPLDQEV